MKLEYGKQHALENGATHHRDGSIYKVLGKVMTWSYGEWVDVENTNDLDGWLEELKVINFDDVES